MSYRIRRAVLLLVCLQGVSHASEDQHLAVPYDAEDAEVISYPIDFFSRYQPQTALDMVHQVPGFQIDDGSGERGFAGASGNVLINGRWPSTKEDLPTEILSRIPVTSVLRIDIVRGQLEAIDLRGKSVAVNVILQDDVPATVSWSLSNRYNLKAGSTPAGTIALSDQLGNVRYNIGMDSRIPNNGDYGPEYVFDRQGTLVEERFDNSDRPGFEGWDLNAFLNASTWLHDTLFTANTNIGAIIRDEVMVTSRRPLLSDEATTYVHVEEEQRELKFEIGLDAERALSDDLIGRAVVLFSRLHQYPVDSQWLFDEHQNLLDSRFAETDADGTEAVGRLEFNWAGWKDHVIHLNVEGAYNVLENRLTQIAITPGEEPVELDVPGANATVEESRADFVVKDVWALGQFKIDYGLGLEISSLSTTGDSAVERRYTFLKPGVVLTYSPDRTRQTRIRFGREVAQLDLTDFVSATVFLDDDLTFGNPDLKPESTWVMEASQQYRFGKLGVVTLTGFHHWVSDVEDLLPITSEFEAPGNIGNGRRWGADVESTVTLDWLGMKNSRLDFRVRWQNSAVRDPVTGQSRVFTPIEGIIPAIGFENDTTYAYRIDYRQDFESSGVSWGFQLAHQPDRPQFKVNELQILGVEPSLDAFIETTRWWNVKLRLDLMNALDYELTRDRTVFVDYRGSSDLEFRELRTWKRARRIQLTVSGTLSGW